MIFAIPVFIIVDLEYSRPRDVLLRTGDEIKSRDVLLQRMELQQPPK